MAIRDGIFYLTKDIERMKNENTEPFLGRIVPDK